jgi:hypothetical protein
MARPHVLQDAQQQAPLQPVLPDEWRRALNGLRITALECRVAARTELFIACALLAAEKDAARDAHARALLRCLRQAIRTNPVFFRPGSAEMSFDEAWLMRALMASKAGDSDSLAFLIRSRVAPQYQRQVVFLIKGIACRALV